MLATSPTAEAANWSWEPEEDRSAAVHMEAGTAQRVVKNGPTEVPDSLREIDMIPIGQIHTLVCRDVVAAEC
jgi:hypothetical protein